MNKWAIMADCLRRVGFENPEGIEEVEGVCCISGNFATKTYKRKNILSSGFTDYDLIASSEGKRICEDAALVLKTPEMRRKNWLAEAGCPIEWIDRPKMWEILRSGYLPEHPWIGYITFAGKKHGSLRAKVNMGTNIWQVEERATVIDSDLVHVLSPVMVDLLNMGCSRASLLSLDLSSKLIKKIGIAKWIRYQQALLPHSQGSLYRLLVWCVSEEMS